MKSRVFISLLLLLMIAEILGTPAYRQRGGRYGGVRGRYGSRKYGSKGRYGGSYGRYGSNGGHTGGSYGHDGNYGGTGGGSYGGGGSNGGDSSYGGHTGGSYGHGGSYGGTGGGSYGGGGSNGGGGSSYGGHNGGSYGHGGSYGGKKGKYYGYGKRDAGINPTGVKAGTSTVKREYATYSGSYGNNGGYGGGNTGGDSGGSKHRYSVTVYQRTYCERSTAKLVCTGDNLVYVVGAFYGRVDAHVCGGKPHYSTKCIAKFSHNKVKSLCNGKKACSFRVDDNLSGDPCKNTYKYLDVKFICAPKAHAVKQSIACTGKIATASCPNNKKVYILHANFGRMDPITCTRQYQATCRGNGSFNRAIHSCHGKSQCSLKASKAIFGDACVGTSKYLQLMYSCK